MRELTAAGQQPFQMRFLAMVLAPIRHRFNGQQLNEFTLRGCEVAIRQQIDSLVYQNSLRHVDCEIEVILHEGQPLVKLSRGGKPLDLNEFDPDPTERQFLRTVGRQGPLR